MKQNNDTKETAVSKLQDTCHLSLEQADERKQIAKNGYEKVKEYHSYDVRIVQMLKEAEIL